MDKAQFLAEVELMSGAETAVTKRYALAVPQWAVEAREALVELLNLGAKESDVDIMLQAERHILQVELDRLATTKERVGSLTAALQEVDAALAAFCKLRDDPAAYRILDQDLSLPKNRIGDLPNDQARQFFNSHRTRLQNDKKSRHTEAEIPVLNARLTALSAAEKKHAALQRRVLGLDKQPGGSENS